MPRTETRAEKKEDLLSIKKKLMIVTTPPPKKKKKLVKAVWLSCGQRFPISNRWRFEATGFQHCVISFDNETLLLIDLLYPGV